MSIDSNSVNPSIRVTPSVGDAPMLSSCITTSHPPKRFTTLITLLCTRGSTRRVFIREVTPHSSLSPMEPISVVTLVSLNAKSFHLMVSTTQCYLSAMLENSPFPFVLPVWKQKWPNLSYNDPPSATTRTTSAR